VEEVIGLHYDLVESADLVVAKLLFLALVVGSDLSHV
jgi:hypothetical protein